MPTATPDTIGDVVGQIIQEAARQAADQPAKLQDLFDQVEQQAGQIADQVAAMPAALLQKLKDLLDPPDWWSLLVLVLVKLSELDARLSVGTMKPAGWSRMVTLTFTQAPGRALTAGLALTDPGTTHGFLLKADADIDSGALEVGPLALSIKTTGAASWTMAFGGPVAKPAEQATINVDLSWDPGIAVGDDRAGVTLGALRATVALSSVTGTPLYAVALGLGDENAKPGAEAMVDLGKVLGVLGTIVHIQKIDESYSPKLTLTQGAGPQFTLGQKSA